MSRTFSVRAFKGTGDNRQALELLDLTVPDSGTGHTQAMIGVLSETVPVASFTDGGSTVGTYQLLGSLPAGANVLYSKIGPVVGFAGNVSATMTIGDGSDVDRYMTGTPSVFTTAAVGVECGVPSGTKLLTAENRPTLTVTTSTDFTLVVTDGSGVVTVSIYYIPGA
jgi:hypothetical protein